MRAELRTLSEQQAERVGSHMLAAVYLADEDPELAYKHALAARRRAARLPVVRELAAEAAYAAGEWADALSEYRAVRRMTGSDEPLPTMADCERALGKPEEALKLARQATRAQLSKEQRVEMRIVEAGARADLGQHAEALRLLKSGIEEFIDAPVATQARIRVAYAEMLITRGKQEDALRWLATAAQLDPEGVSGAQDRLDELSGVGIDGGFEVELADDEDETPRDRERYDRRDQGYRDRGAERGARAEVGGTGSQDGRDIEPERDAAPDAGAEMAPKADAESAAGNETAADEHSPQAD